MKIKGILICSCKEMVDAETCRTKCPKGKDIKPDMFCEVPSWKFDVNYTIKKL